MIKKTVIFFLMVGCAGQLIAQARIKFHKDSILLGQVEEGPTISVEYPFTNIGTDTLIISDVRGSGGPFVGSGPRKPIAPGESDVIQGSLWTQGRPGVFSKILVVRSNSIENEILNLYISGEVILPKTTMTMNRREANIGTLNFGEVDSVDFEITNTGTIDLFVRRADDQSYCEADLFSYAIYMVADTTKAYWDRRVAPGKKIGVTIIMKNRHGNTGSFERTFLLKTNVQNPGSHDTLQFKVKGIYKGIPDKEKLFEGGSIFFYKEGKLIKRETYSENRRRKSEEFYEGGYCVHSKQYAEEKGRLYQEYFFKKGKQVGYKYYKVY